MKVQQAERREGGRRGRKGGEKYGLEEGKGLVDDAAL